MKKAFLIILILTFSSANAQNIEYTNPIYDTIDEYIEDSDVYDWYNPQPNYRIWVHENYMDDWTDTATAERFCSLLSQAYVSHILQDNVTNQNTAYFFVPTQQWWNTSTWGTRYSKIICEIQNQTWTWSTWSWETNVYINNIDSYEGINKSVFDEDTLIEIYQYEALIMIFIMLFKFFNRVLWIKAKRKWYFL